MLKLLSFADLISISNALFGIIAILVLFTNVVEFVDLRLRVSFSFIFLALLADGLDGIVARRFGKSEIGEYLEAMGDMTSLVIAPAVFTYVVYFSSISSDVLRLSYMFIALILFLFFGVIRLASFHIMKDKHFFIGLPASVSTIILLVLVYFKTDFVYILFVVIVIGALMASDIKFPKPGIIINGIAMVLILLTLIFDKTFYGFAPILLLAAILFYAIVGPIYKNFW